jgi:hypothetical protein
MKSHKDQRSLGAVRKCQFQALLDVYDHLLKKVIP